MNWHKHLQDRLLEIHPTSVCALDASANHLAGSVLPNASVSMPGTLPDSPCTLALGVDVLNELDAPQSRHLINQTRLYAAPRILLAARSDCALDEEAFRALGFTLSATDPAEIMRIFYYDIDTYKMVPDWLNSRFWANPERWEP
ncbi:MAG: DUF6231 family protein [Thiobacillus sp.]